MKATTKKGLIIGGVILTLGAIGFLIWRANKKKEEELLLDETAPSGTLDVKVDGKTPVSVPTSSSTSSSSTKPSQGSSVGTPTPNPNVKRVTAIKDGVLIGDSNNTPVPMAVIKRFKAGEYIGFTTGRKVMSGSSVRVQVLRSNVKGWVLLSDVKI